MKKKALFAVLGIIIVLLSVVAVIYFTRNASRPADPVEEAMKSLTVYTEEGFRLYLSEDGSYYTFGGVSNFEGTELVIPAYYNGIPITKISHGTLTPNRKNLKSVSIPDTVTEINSNLYFNDLEKYPLEFNQYEHGYYLGNENNPYHALMIYDPNYGKQAKVHPDTKVLSYCAFDECRLLTEVILPEGLLSIGTHAFLRCESLEQITVPDSVTHVGEYTFSQCSSIEKVVLGSGITEISDRMFAHCSSLTSVEFRGKITRIGEQAFAWTLSLESFEIPESVTEIAANAFKNSSLKKVIIHKGVKSISIAAFPESVEYNEYGGALYLGDSQNPYLYLVGIKDTEADSLVLHPDTYSVSQQIIPMTSALTSLSVEGGKGKYLYSDGNCIIRKEDKTLLCGIGTSVIPQKGIKEIAPYAFTNCENLKNAVIPDTVKIIGEYAFYKCKNLESVTIPKSVLEIPEHCFYSCDLLSEVILSDKTEIIEEAAFSGCKALKSISLHGVKLIDSMAFSDCVALESVSFSEKLGYIGNLAFSDCVMLKNVVLPYGLRYIGSAAFFNCDSLKYLNIPKSVEKCGQGICKRCSSIENAIVPEGVESLSAREFEICTSLKKILLPSTLKEISGYALLGLCSSLEEIVYNGTVEQWNAIEKSDSWCIATPAFRIVCTDGVIEHPGDDSKYVGNYW